MQPACLILIKFASVMVAIQVAAAELACQDSGYCSSGKLAPFVGDIYPSKRRRLLQLVA